MAEKDQEHLRIRLGARLLKRIDAAREKSGRTRTDEIEFRIEESFRRIDLQEVVGIATRVAVRETLLAVEQRAKEQKGQTFDFFEALMGKPKGEEQ